MRKGLVIGAGLVLLATRPSFAQDSTATARPDQEAHRFPARWRDWDRQERIRWRIPRDFDRMRVRVAPRIAPHVRVRPRLDLGATGWGDWSFDHQPRLRIRAPERIRVRPNHFGGRLDWQRDLVREQGRWQRDWARRQLRWQADFDGMATRWRSDFPAPRIRVRPWQLHRGPASGHGRYLDL